jgi:G3E family GTPase
LHYLELQARNNIRGHLGKKLPFEYDKCIVALNSLQRKAWEISERSDEERTQVQALSLAKECLINKMDLLTNATVVDDAMRFIEQAKDKLKLTKQKEDSQELRELDHHKKDSSDKQGKEEQEEETEELISTTNQVF